MAIIFDKQLTLTDLLLSYNNNTVTFKSNSALTQSKATITFGDKVFTLFPDPAGKFHFNFKYSVSTLINGTNNFSDSTDFDLITPIANAFKTRVINDGGTFEAFDCLVSQITTLGNGPIIDWTDYIFKNYSVTYKIFFTNSTSETEVINYNFLSAYVNPQTYKQLYPGFPYNANTTQMILKPITYLKYWKGYPFDFTWYNGLMNDISIGNVLYENSDFFKTFDYTLNTTPIINQFYTASNTWARPVGQTVTFKFNNIGAENIFAVISINDIIKVTTGNLAGHKLKVTSISSVDNVYTFNLEILSNAGFIPNEGTQIPFTFELQNDVVEILNITNNKRINRIILSNGNELIELENAYNKLLINGIALQIENITEHCIGHYLKWLNSFGGWNYWLFNKGNDTLTTKDLGSIYNDYNDVVDTISPNIEIGKTSENNITVVQENLTPDDFLILNDILESPKVYLFTGVQNEVAQANDWLEVSIKSGAFRVSNAREKMTNLNLTIGLPMNNTKTL